MTQNYLPQFRIGDKVKLLIDGCFYREGIVVQVENAQQKTIYWLNSEVNTLEYRSWQPTNPNLLRALKNLKILDTHRALAWEHDQVTHITSWRLTKQRKYPNNCPCGISSFDCTYHNE